MKPCVLLAALALVASAPLFAQTPKGWKMRVDRSTSASDPEAPAGVWRQRSRRRAAELSVLRGRAKLDVLTAGFARPAIRDLGLCACCEAYVKMCLI
jgi:hypothetical protein